MKFSRVMTSVAMILDDARYGRSDRRERKSCCEMFCRQETPNKLAENRRQWKRETTIGVSGGDGGGLKCASSRQ